MIAYSFSRKRPKKNSKKVKYLFGDISKKSQFILNKYNYDYVNLSGDNHSKK